MPCKCSKHVMNLIYTLCIHAFDTDTCNEATVKLKFHTQHLCAFHSYAHTKMMKLIWFDESNYTHTHTFTASKGLCVKQKCTHQSCA